MFYARGVVGKEEFAAAALRAHQAAVDATKSLLRGMQQKSSKSTKVDVDRTEYVSKHCQTIIVQMQEIRNTRLCREYYVHDLRTNH